MSCTPSEEGNTCYSFINDTPHTVELKMYQFLDNGSAREQLFSITGNGVFIRRCANGNPAPRPMDVYKTDSLVIVFNNSRRLIYVKAETYRQSPPIFQNHNYRENGSFSYDYSWHFTEQDFQDAVPF